MVDFEAIETAVANQIKLLCDFKSTEIGNIREAIPINGMPSLDIASQGHKTLHTATKTYVVPVLMLISIRGYDRAATTTKFKETIVDICAGLEHFHDSAFDAIRNISSEFGKDVAGDGNATHTAAIRIDVLTH